MCMCVCAWGRYKQWNGLLKWYTGLDYRNEIFPAFQFPPTMYVRYCVAINSVE